MTYSNSARYLGGWVDGLYHGAGELEWRGGDRYTGQFRCCSPVTIGGR